MPHKFILGQAVKYSPTRGLYAPHGIYVVTAALPERNGEFEYQIKHPNEAHERVVRESELSITRGGEISGPGGRVMTTEIIEYMGYRLDRRPFGKGWRVLIYPPGTNSALSEYASDLEKDSKEAVVVAAKKIVDAHLGRKLKTP
jgi:hypothetical protein